MSHVTVTQRYTIEVMLTIGCTKTEIAEAIGKDKSTIGREIKRNCDLRNGSYTCNLAQRKSESRQKEKTRYVKFTEEVQVFVETKIRKNWSPEQISNCPEIIPIGKVSHETIYKHIIQDKKEGGDLYKHCRRKKSYKKRFKTEETRGKIKDKKSITERPPIVDKKTRVGDFEVDLIMGANHKGAMITMNDRKTGYAFIRLVKSKDSKLVADKIIKALKPYRGILKTITSDNGKEFADFKKIEKALNIRFYFAEPYSSWQRGANENFNGLVRQYYPKKTNFEQLSQSEINRIEKELNQRPRKRLEYRTPKEEFIFLTKKVAFAA